MAIDINEISTLLEEAIPSIPEAEFTYRYLPLFMGEYTEKEAPKVISAWIKIATTPTSPVHVVDTDGEVLFTVPPLVDTSRLEITDNDHFAYAAAILNTYRTNQPERGAVMFEAETKNALANSVAVHEPTSGLEGMYRYYGITDAAPSTPAPVVEDVLGDLGL